MPDRQLETRQAWKKYQGKFFRRLELMLIGITAFIVV